MGVALGDLLQPAATAFQRLTGVQLDNALAVAGSVAVAAGVARLWALRRALRLRRAYAVMPTSRFPNYPNNANVITLFGKSLSQVRLRRLRPWTRPAGAVRVRLDSISSGGMLYSVAVPPWARGAVETSAFSGMVMCPYDALDLCKLTPKGMQIPPTEQPRTEQVALGAAAGPRP